MSIKNILLEYNSVIQKHAINRRFMYHYTHVDNIENIMDVGLLKNKNENYKDGCIGIHMTTKLYPDDANLPAHLWGEYENSFNDDGSMFETIIARITINILKLDEKQFFVDDDHKMLSKNDNIEDSLYKTSSICYGDNIGIVDITEVEFYTDFHSYENVTKLFK